VCAEITDGPLYEFKRISFVIGKFELDQFSYQDACKFRKFLKEAFVPPDCKVIYKIVDTTPAGVIK
jgi:hypothetical protein